jgi:1-phosphofructokinase family hexose kinase
VRNASVITVTPNPAVDWVFDAPYFGVGKHIEARRVAHHPAGKGVNVSRVLATMGVRSIATGFIGRGELRMFEEHLERHCDGRVICQLLVVRAKTRDNITIVDPVDETETHIRDQGFTVQPTDASRLESKVSLLARPGVTMAFCGSLPPGLSPMTLRRMVSRSREAGAQIILDTSGKALEAVRSEKAWMVKVNARELSTLADAPTTSPEEILDAARKCSVDGGGAIDYVVVTLGMEGAILVGPGIALRGRVMVHPGRIVSTVGSGDSLLSGLLAGWFRSGDWTEALRDGLAAATSNSTTRAAGFVDLEGVEEFRQVAMIEPV